MPLPSSSWTQARMTSACVSAGGGGFPATMTAAPAEECDIVLGAHCRPAFDAFTIAVLGASGVDVPLIVASGESGVTVVAAIHTSIADFVSRDRIDCLTVVAAECLGHQRRVVNYAQDYVIGHRAPIPGLSEECPPWPT
jgi:hypothetical protein